MTVEHPKLMPSTSVIYRSLDAWRGFAALWVVMVHALMPTTTRFPELTQRASYQFPLWGALGVQVFFVISGFCIANAALSAYGKTNGWLTFARARAFRIYPTYLAAVLLSMFSVVIARWLVDHHYVATSVSASQPLNISGLYLFSTATLTQPLFRQPQQIIVAWTLSYEVAFYAVVLFIITACQSCNASRERVFDSLHAVTIVSIGWLIIRPEHVVFPFDLWPQFGLGVIVFDLLCHPFRRRRVCVIFALATVGLMTFAWAWDLDGRIDHPSTRTQSLATLIFAIVLLLLYQSDEWLSRALPIKAFAFIGVFSYSLYLSHLLVLGVVLQFSKRIATTADRFAAVFWLQIIFALGVGVIFWMIFERPITRHMARHRSAASTTKPTS